MFKLVKYELRSTFLTILGICISVIAANLFLMTRKASWGINIISGLSICLFMVAMVVIFISSLKIMSKYLHEDSGYLLFTLPQSGMSIVASRLITALIQISIVGCVSFLMFNFTVTQGIDLSFLKNVNVKVILYAITQYVWIIFSFLAFIYFCMVIGKVALKGKKLGKIGSFIIFIVLTAVMGWLSFKINTIFPQTLNLGAPSINSSFNAGNAGFSISSAVGSIKINIASTIFDIITFVGFFISTSYLIDKKLDLS
jgi:ABC-2 type transport system permease protein